MFNLSTKKLLLINDILLVLIAITIVGTILFNNYLYVPYDPFDDPSEYERLSGTRLSDEEIPDNILESADKAMNDFAESLERKAVYDLKIGKIVALLNNDGNYHLKYILVDEKENLIIATFYLIFLKNGNIKNLQAEYRYFNEHDFLLYNDTLINVKSFNISENDKYQINKNFEKGIDYSWKIGNKYRYDYFNERPEGAYGGIRDLKKFVINFS